MGLSDLRKDELRARWRQNETEYLREQRCKVDVSAFVKLKTIGHGEFVVVFTNCVQSETVFPRAAPENGIVMVAYHVVCTSQSRIRQTRSPENTWN